MHQKKFFEILYPAKSHFILLFDLSWQEQNNWKLLERLNQTFFRCSAFPSFFIKTKIKPHRSIYHAKFNKYVKFIKIHRDVIKTWNTTLFFTRNVHREGCNIFIILQKIPIKYKCYKFKEGFHLGVLVRSLTINSLITSITKKNEVCLLQLTI